MTSKNGQTLVFPHIITNVGGGYNGNTGVFTAPRDGVYVFFCRITGTENASDMVFEFIMNGLVKTRNLLFARSPNPYRTSSSSIVLQLSHGDRVWIKMALGGNHFNAGVGGDQTFSGYLLWLWFFKFKKCMHMYISAHISHNHFYFIHQWYTGITHISL